MIFRWLVKQSYATQDSEIWQKVAYSKWFGNIVNPCEQLALVLVNQVDIILNPLAKNHGIRAAFITVSPDVVCP